MDSTATVQFLLLAAIGALAIMYFTEDIEL